MRIPGGQDQKVGKGNHQTSSLGQGEAPLYRQLPVSSSGLNKGCSPIRSLGVQAHGRLVLQHVCDYFPLTPMYTVWGHSFPSQSDINVYCQCLELKISLTTHSSWPCTHTGGGGGWILCGNESLEKGFRRYRSAIWG